MLSSGCRTYSIGVQLRVHLDTPFFPVDLSQVVLARATRIGTGSINLHVISRIVQDEGSDYAHLVMPVGLKDVKDSLDVLEIVDAGTFTALSSNELPVKVELLLLTFFPRLPEGHGTLKPRSDQISLKLSD